MPDYSADISDDETLTNLDSPPLNRPKDSTLHLSDLDPLSPQRKKLPRCRPLLHADVYSEDDVHSDSSEPSARHPAPTGQS